MQIKRRQHSTETIQELMHLPPVLQRIYQSRGIKRSEQLEKQLKAMLPFHLLKDIDKACNRLEKAIRQNEKILIVGDFDADGATSTSVAITALRAMGAKQVEYLVPNRFDFGYGLTPAIIEVSRSYAPNLIITVDNGIASHEGVKAANDAGIDVVITDHHLPPETLPEAAAIVNPNQLGCSFPSKSIAGVGVIFYTMAALRRQLSENGWFDEQGIEPPNMASFLDLVALGTVADVVALDQNNRLLVHQGLLRMRAGRARPGIKGLAEVAGRDLSRIQEADLGFALAPRLNAAGRLDDMSLGIECLIADSLEKATEIAGELNFLNQERRKIETEMKAQALANLEKLELKEAQLPNAICLADESWHQGVIGILAGRLKERYHRPVIAFAKVSETELKGSARSIAVLNIRDVLAAVDKDNPGLITKFGGHAMAAGISLPPEHFDTFKNKFIHEVNQHIDASDCQAEIWTDGALSDDEFSLEIAQMLADAGPWGQQFPSPCFDNTFDLLEQRLVGKNHLKMSLRPAGGQQVIDAIAFNINLSEWPNHRARKIHAAFRLDINVFQGRSKLQLMIDTFYPVE